MKKEILKFIDNIDIHNSKFSEILNFIDQHYTHIPTAFTNGVINNDETQNQGSAKVFKFAKMHQLDQKQTLKLFGEHYLNVIENPEQTNHQNIRQFIENGWEGINFVEK